MNNKFDASVQTTIYCYEDISGKLRVFSDRNCQSVISSFPIKSDETVFFGLLSHIPEAKLNQIGERVIVLPRKRKLQWATVNEMDSDDESSDDTVTKGILKQERDSGVTKSPPQSKKFVSEEIQTNIIVYPHILGNNEVAQVLMDVSCQTSITALPNDSNSNLIPYLKTQLPHLKKDEIDTTSKITKSINDNNLTFVSKIDSSPAKDPTEATENSTESSLNDDINVTLEQKNDQFNKVEQNSQDQFYDSLESNLEEVSPENIEELTKENELDNEKSIPNEEIQLVEEKIKPNSIPATINSSEKVKPCPKDPCVATVIQRNDCFENKLKGILQLAVEAFENELVTFLEKSSTEDDKKAALCKELVNYANVSLTTRTEFKSDEEEWEEAVRNLEKIAEELVDSGANIYSYDTKNRDDVIQDEGMYYVKSSAVCTCQKNSSKFPQITPTKHPKVSSSNDIIKKSFGDNFLCNKVPKILKKPSSRLQNQLSLKTASNDVFYLTFNLPSSQRSPRQSKVLQAHDISYDKYCYRPPITMKRNIQLGVGFSYCLGGQYHGSDVTVEEIPSPQPVQDFVYQCDTEYTESYLESLGTEIKGCQTEVTSTGEGDWDWDLEEEDDATCFCDPWKKIAVPAPGTYVLKKKKHSFGENSREVKPQESPNASNKKLTQSNEANKLPVYDPKYLITTELYMEPLYDLFPMDIGGEDICGPETEMPWEDILLPEKVRIKKANPTICTCSDRPIFSVYSENSPKEDDHISNINNICCGRSQNNSQLKNEKKSSTVVIKISTLDSNTDSCSSNSSTDVHFPSDLTKSKTECNCPKRQQFVESESKLPSRSPCSILHKSKVLGKSKPMELPSNPPKGFESILRNVSQKKTEPLKEKNVCTGESNGANVINLPSNPPKGYRSIIEGERKKHKKEKIENNSRPYKNTPSSKSEQKYNPNLKLKLDLEKVSKSKCCCKKISVSNNDEYKNEARTNASQCKVSNKNRLRGGVSRNVGCNSIITFIKKSTAEMRDSFTECDGRTFICLKNDHTMTQKPSNKSISTCFERSTDVEDSKIKTTVTIRRKGKANESVSKEIPLNNELHEIYNKGPTKVQLGIRQANFDCYKTNQKSKYPVVDALNAFENEMKPLRAALGQLQKRIYSLDLPEIQPNISAPAASEFSMCSKGSRLTNNNNHIYSTESRGISDNHFSSSSTITTENLTRSSTTNSTTNSECECCRI